MTNKSHQVKYLARVEGEGGLNIQIKDDAVTRVQLKIFEPPRFFEAFLKGRNFTEAPDITCRICGICPVAYQMSAVHALEGRPGGDGLRPHPGPAAAAVLRRVDRVPRPPRLHAPRPGLPGVPGRHPDGPGPSGHGENGAQVEEGGKRHRHGPGRPGDPPHQRPGGRLL